MNRDEFILQLLLLNWKRDKYFKNVYSQKEYFINIEFKDIVVPNKLSSIKFKSLKLLMDYIIKNDI